MAILFVGIDLAKSVFAVHGVNEAGRPELVRPAVPRARLLELIAALPPCTLGMQACSGAHHWARLFMAHGHTVRLMAPKLVVPYRMSGKRGKRGRNDAAEVVRRKARNRLEELPGYANLVIGDLLSEVARLDERIKQYDVHIRTMARACTAARQLMPLMGVGETTATAIVPIATT